MVNPPAAHLVKNPNNTAVAPNGSTIESNFVVNRRKGDMPGGALDQNGNFA